MTPKPRSMLYIDCFSGIAGDMMLAALLDLDDGCAEAIRACLAGFEDLGMTLVEDEAMRSGIRGKTVRFEVAKPERQSHRSMADIRRLLDERDLAPGVRARALAAFEVVADAEGVVHGRPAEEVHFHEVGALDSIGDFVGVAAGLDALDAEIHSAPAPLGRGFVECRHGTIPVPAPATLAVLRGVPVEGTDVEDELVTPTGAAILRTQVTSFGSLPAMRPRSIGWGAGDRDRPGRPGLLRLVLGEPLAEPAESGMAVLEANIDDMTAEVAAHCIERLLEEGAVDAWIAPITMKKGRPAMTLGALLRRVDRDRLATVVLTESTTIGLRTWDVERYELSRELVEVETPWGTATVKIAGSRDGGPFNAAPELESCRTLAREAGVPLKAVMAAALSKV